MSSSDAPEAPAARVEVVGGGTVDAEELAAVVVALTPTASAEVATEADRVPAWARAAMLENVSDRRIASRADLHEPGGP